MAMARGGDVSAVGSVAGHVVAPLAAVLSHGPVHCRTWPVADWAGWHAWVGGVVKGGRENGVGMRN